MIYTERMNDAVQFVIEVHQLVGGPQYRKGKAVPYVTHPLAVGLILSQAGASEDIVLAGILHDVIEDSDSRKAITKEMISERFMINRHTVYSVSWRNQTQPVSGGHNLFRYTRGVLQY